MTSLPKKVLHVMNSATGGAAMSTLGLMHEFRKQGIASCAVCHDAGNATERQLLLEATDGATRFVPLYWWNCKTRMPAWRRPLSEIKQLLRTGWGRGSTRAVTDWALQHDVDLIHTNTITTPEGGFAARRLRLPHVWHLRELVGADSTFRLPLEGRQLGAYLAAHCSKLIANSDVTASHVRDILPKGLLEVVPNGIDLGRFHPRDQADRGERLVVAMVGNPTSRWKKHPLFVEAATRVDRGLPIEWRIYGHDPSEGGRKPGDAYLDAMHARIAEAGLGDRFVWPGWIGDPAEVMSQIDLLVHPADGESFGRIVVEAMAAGLPTIGVRGGGVGEIIDDGVTGLLVAPDDPDQMAAAIEKLARDPQQRRAPGAAGRQRAEARYSLEACAAGVLRVYEMAMQRPVNAVPETATARAV